MIINLYQFTQPFTVIFNYYYYYNLIIIVGYAIMLTKVKLIIMFAIFTKFMFIINLIG